MPRKRHKLIAVVALTILILLYRHLQSSWDAQQLKPVAWNDGQRPGGAPLSNIDKSHTLASGESQGDDGTSVDEKEELSSGSGPDGWSRNNVHTEVGSKSQDETEKVLGQTDEDHSSKPTSDEVASPPATPTGRRWKKPKEHFPLPKESIITLPAGSAKDIPRIQHIFPTESEKLKEKRLRRLTMVKNEIQRSWAGYKQYAWMHDEITPVSNRSRDPFCGWAATLVDSLDTLWIAGLKDEFDEAAAAVKIIDFTYTNRSTIPVFETTIRYLGGLLAAYDVSGGASGHYSFLLDKAVELAEILMGIFDTPNRMPVLYFHWRPEDTSRPRRARRAGMAEIATLSMEFTRLAQVTGRHTYYDAIDRITNALIDMQRTGTLIPGLFPEHLDITGCSVAAAIEQKLKSKASTKQADSASNLKERKDGTTTRRLSSTNVDDRRESSFSLHSREISAEAALAADEVTADKLPRDDQLPNGVDGHDEELGCIAQGLVPVDNGYQEYHMGGGQDSAYEYFGKEYLLLGGKESKYQKLYEDTVDGINKHLLFRPMIPDDWDIIFPARVGIKADTNVVPNIEYEVTHLTCFIGGMYALGGKLFGRQKDIEYAAKLTDGCVWAYQSTASGIMPESGYLVPCPTFKQCSFNETLWRQALDPLADSRDQRILDWEAIESGKQMEQREKRKAERQKEDMVRVRTDRVGKVVSAEHNTFSQTSFSSSHVAPEKTSALEKRSVIPVTPSDPNLSTSRASDEEVNAVVAEKGLEYGATRSQTRNKQVPEAKSELSALKEDNPRHSGPAKVPALKSHHSQRPRKPPTHQEFVEEQIQKGVPRGFSSVSSKQYILRPEAIESVWYMYRITGDASWMEKGWAMFEATMKATRTPSANTAIANVLSQEHEPLDTMESFWLAETLKYYYLLFSESSLISLDEWVLNTEAHPFKLETKA
ncbi:hypothetical protein E4U10_000371 [Claviceps purpurea]|nr:hypothetical protein E4U10_000371 [Claviceps purpurea]KAG6228580.1 hypothetical protein E4U26_000927 [Claviceps purpurea]